VLVVFAAEEADRQDTPAPAAALAAMAIVGAALLARRR
jgi:MYXO-CTERM domain-containing protein